MLELLVWIVTLLALASGLVLWFDFSLPQTIFLYLYRMGWRRNDYWPEELILETWTREQWEEWAIVALKPRTFVLFTCPGCFVTRLTIAVAILVGVFTLNWWLPFVILGTHIYGALMLYHLHHKLMS